MSVLERYLSYVIFGKRGPRRPARRRRGGPARDRRYMEWIREQACCCCGREERAHPHHSGWERGLAQKASDFTCVALCGLCHSELHEVGQGEFERRHGRDLAAITVLFQIRFQRVKEAI